MSTHALRVALIRQRYTPFGGAERFVERALGALVREGAEVTMVARSWEGAAQSGFQTRLCDPAYSSLWGGRTARDRSFSLAVQRLMAAEKYDITQSHERIPGCMIFRAGDGVHAAWLAHRAAGRNRFRSFLDRFSAFHRFILAQEAEMLASPLLQAVICNSVMVAEEMQHYYRVPESRLVLIENGVDLAYFHPRLSDEWRIKQREAIGISPETPVFLFVGSGFERKGIPSLLCAMQQMKNKTARLMVVGRDRQLSFYAQQARGLGDRVSFLGPQQDVRPWYGMADAFVLPTRYDPMPNAALEALACGLPLLTSTTCGMAARVTQGQNGFVCGALDVDKMAVYLDELAAPHVAASMSAAARASVADLNLESMAEKLLALYRRLH